MIQENIDYRDCDRQIWEEELADFVPSRIFDSHIHFFWRSNITAEGIPPIQIDETDLNTLNQWAKVLYPGRRMQYLIQGTPIPGVQKVQTSIRKCPPSKMYDFTSKYIKRDFP